MTKSGQQQAPIFKQPIVMKNLLLAILCLGIMQSFAQHQLTVFSEVGEPFYLEVNGIRQNGTASTNVQVEGLMFDLASVRIEFANSLYPAITRGNLMLKGIDCPSYCATSYRIKANRKGEYILRAFAATPIETATPQSAEVTVIEYHSTPLPQETTTTTVQVTEQTTTANNQLNIPVNQGQENISMDVNMGGVGMDMNIDINVNESSSSMGSSTSMNVQETTTTNVQVVEPSSSNDVYQENVSMDMNIGGVEFDMDININDGMPSTSSGNSTTTTTTTTTTTSPQAQYIPAPTPAAPPCTMSNSDFNDVLESIEDKSFSDSKMAIAKQVSRSNCLTADQIKQIMLAFDFESDRLDFAIYAYRECADPDNYYKVYSAFDFELSIDDLEEAIH